MKRLIIAVLFCLLADAVFAAGPAALAALKAAGVRSGLIVHLGCRNGETTGALRLNDRCLVHGLVTDAGQVAVARNVLKGQGKYGPVSIDAFNGKQLPYADNLVNALVAEALGAVSREEVMRVLAPGGVFLLKNGGTWSTTVKPRPAEMDEWTHYLHGPDNNAVSRDRLVGPPSRLRWSAGPVWPRSHEYTPSLSSMVSADGKLFYLHDDGIRGVLDQRLPERWFVYARDAYNGLFLWRVPLPNWGPDEWKHSRHWHTPLTLSRRLVVSDKKVYVTLGYRAPVSVLDTDAGVKLKTFESTANTDEILCVGDTLVVRQRRTIPNYAEGAEAWNIHVRAKKGKKEPKGVTQLPAVESGPQSIMAVDAETGELRWKVDCGTMMTLSLSATSEYVCYHDFEQAVCLRFNDGKELWRVAAKSWPDLIGTSGTMLIHDGAVYLAGTSGVQAWDAATGAELWRGPRIARTTIRHPPDMFIADGLLWGGLTPDMPTGRLPHEEAPEVAPAAGQIMVFDENTTYTLQVFSKQYFMSPSFTPGTGYLLRADPHAKGKGRAKPRFTVRVPVRARGLTLAGDTLFLAGSPDILPQDDPYAALEGKKGALLWAVSAKDGRKMAAMPLDAPPVSDGLAAANGRLYLCCVDGRVVCLDSLRGPR